MGPDLGWALLTARIAADLSILGGQIVVLSTVASRKRPDSPGSRRTRRWFGSSAGNMD
jgi:hypothetical protein